MRERLEALVKKYNYQIIMCAVFIIIFAGFLFVLKKQIENFYNMMNKDLIEDYYEQIESTSETTLTTSDLYYEDNTATTEEEYQLVSGVDCILRVPSMNIELPVCKGNFNEDIEDFRLSVYNSRMVLGSTTYSILGHHAIQLKVAMGWLEDIEMGTKINFEKYGHTYLYYVSDIRIDYASEMTEVFSVMDSDKVYLATCDYSKGKTGKTVYRVVTCTPLN